MAVNTVSPIPNNTDDEKPAQVVIVGAGIVGLVLALALDAHLGVKAELYEKVQGFHADVGAGMGMYPNGLRVLRDISPDLLHRIRAAGYPYLYRRWERHDGTEVAVAQEDVLAPDEEELQSIGIRRWRLQKVLYEEVLRAGMTIHFDKKIQAIRELTKDGMLRLEFEDGSRRLAEVVFGADGARSKIRELMETGSKLEYTGVTCVMGMAQGDPSERGISFPSSLTTKCHGCFFPTSSEESCFQMHFPVDAEEADQGNWGTLSEKVGLQECEKLGHQMKEDGWHDKYVEPLLQVRNAVRIGFCLLNPPLNRWVWLNNRLVLLGDAAHAPVPYTGQGAQMGLEDAGTIALLLKHFCLDQDGKLDLSHFSQAMKIYQKIRIPRTLEINTISQSWGKCQQKRANREKYNEVKEEKIRREVFYHETLPIMIPGATFNYGEAVASYLKNEPLHLPAVQEEASG